MILRNFCAGAFALALSAAPAMAQIGPSGVSGTAPVASISTTCPASGPSTGAVTLATGTQPVSISASSDPITAADCGKFKSYSNATSTAVALPSAASFGANFIVTLSAASGAGAVTVTSAGGTFSLNGTTSLALAAGQSVTLISDGANWKTSGIAGGGSGSSTLPAAPVFRSVSATSTYNPPNAQAPIPIIMDDDYLGYDGILIPTLMHNLIDAGRINVLAWISDENNSNGTDGPMLNIFNQWYACGGVPLCDSAVQDARHKVPIGRYTGANAPNIANNYAALIAAFNPGDSNSNYPTDCAALERQKLAAATANSVRMVVTGSFACVSALMQSAANYLGDGLPSGANLIQSKMEGLYIFGGHTAGASFNATITSATTMTVTSVAYGSLAVGQHVWGAGVTNGVTITAGSGGVGTYTITSSSNVSGAMFSGNTENNIIVDIVDAKYVFDNWTSSNSYPPMYLTMYENIVTTVGFPTTWTYSSLTYAATSASIAGTTLTLPTTPTSGLLYPGSTVVGSGITTGTMVVGQLTGVTGGAGTYKVNKTNAVGPISISGAYQTGSPLTLAKGIGAGPIPVAWDEQPISQAVFGGIRSIWNLTEGTQNVDASTGASVFVPGAGSGVFNPTPPTTPNKVIVNAQIDGYYYNGALSYYPAGIAAGITNSNLQCGLQAGIPGGGCTSAAMVADRLTTKNSVVSAGIPPTVTGCAGTVAGGADDFTITLSAACAGPTTMTVTWNILTVPTRRICDIQDETTLPPTSSIYRLPAVTNPTYQAQFQVTGAALNDKLSGHCGAY